jgi:uncharacterized protein involved in exopolysaccharide biosynthesis
VKYQETMFELLAKQFEMAKIDEARDSSLVQVLDEAVEPEVRSRPRRKQIVLLAAVVALLSGIGLAFVVEWAARPGGLLADSERLDALRRQLRWKPRSVDRSHLDG